LLVSDGMTDVIRYPKLKLDKIETPLADQNTHSKTKYKHRASFTIHGGITTDMISFVMVNQFSNKTVFEIKNEFNRKYNTDLSKPQYNYLIQVVNRWHKKCETSGTFIQKFAGNSFVVSKRHEKHEVKHDPCKNESGGQIETLEEFYNKEQSEKQKLLSDEIAAVLLARIEERIRSATKELQNKNALLEHKLMEYISERAEYESEISKCRAKIIAIQRAKPDGSGRFRDKGKGGSGAKEIYKEICDAMIKSNRARNDYTAMKAALQIVTEYLDRENQNKINFREADIQPIKED